MIGTMVSSGNESAHSNGQAGPVDARAAQAADALLRLIEEAGETLSLPEVAGRVCRRTVELIPCDRCAIGLWNERGDAIIPVADHGTPAHLLPRLAARYRDAGRIAFAPELCAGDTLVASRDEPLTREWARWIEEAELYALAVVPLRGRAGPLGWLTLGLDAPPRFTETALSIARGVARQAAPLIDNARLFTNAQKAAVFRAGVAELAVALNAWNDRAVIARLVCKRGAELFEVSSGVFFQRADDELIVVGAVGP